MKKIILVLLIVSVTLFTITAQDKLEVGKKVPEWVLPDANKVDHSMDTWEGKVLQINYVDPDEEALNDPFNDAVDLALEVEKRIDEDYFKGFGIVDSQSTWKPNGVIRMIAKKKAKKYDTTIVFDYEGILHEKWGVPEDSYTIAIIDKERVCRALYIGKIPDEEIESIIQMIIKLTAE